MRTFCIVTALSVAGVFSAWRAPQPLLAARWEQSLPVAKPGDGQQLPPGVFRPQSGVTTPRVIREVKPTYTPDAMRAKIEGAVIVECVVQPDGTVGDVRVIRSLDPIFGLDQGAVNAAKQWRFLPGTKDNVAVPVVVAIELSFTLAAGGPSGPAPLTWPQEFPSAGDIPDSTQWTEQLLEESGVRLRLTYPARWHVTTAGPATQWFGVQSDDRFARLVIVNRPLVATVPLAQPLHPAALEHAVDDITQSLSASNSGARLLGAGQAQSARRIWLWHELSVPASALPQTAAPGLQQSFDGATVWSFMATAGRIGIAVNCYLMRPRGASEEQMQAEARQAATQFRTILERMVIEAQ